MQMENSRQHRLVAWPVCMCQLAHRPPGLPLCEQAEEFGSQVLIAHEDDDFQVQPVHAVWCMASPMPSAGVVPTGTPPLRSAVQRGPAIAADSTCQAFVRYMQHRSEHSGSWFGKLRRFLPPGVRWWNSGSLSRQPMCKRPARCTRSLRVRCTPAFPSFAMLQSRSVTRTH